jgi:nicotinamidase-related amidase
MDAPALRLDRDRSIVVIVDMQGRLMEMVHRPRLVIDATVRLLRLAELFAVPVVLTEQYPRGLGPTHDVVRAGFDALSVPRREVVKDAFGCCEEPGFEAALAALRPGLEPHRRQIVLAGIETHICVMQTALALREQGTPTFVCWECTSCRGEEVLAHALGRLRQAGVVVTHHESVGFEWAADKNHPAFRAMSALFKEGQLP